MEYNSAAAAPLAPESVETRIVIGPNASLSARQAWLFMGLSASLALGISAGMAWLGFWPVLPFAGLEISALGAAVYVSVRRNGYREVLVFEAQRVRVEFGVVGRGAGTVVELSRALTRVLLEPGAHRHEPTQLVLSCTGQRVRIGACLTDEERGRVAVRVKQLLTPAWSWTQAGAGAAPAQELPLGE
ncbi:MAG: DUF2244 domain-containing protein [Sinimarinibacterium sp.]|jgi:uncharacterized membrane protein